MTENLKIVYLFGYNPKEGAHIDTLLSLINAQNPENSNLGIVLIHDGVLTASSKRKDSELIKKLMDLPIMVYVMAPDLKARGIALDYIKDGVKPIDYKDLVDILDSSEKVISWMWEIENYKILVLS